MKKIILLICLQLVALSVWSQQDALVFFQDKVGVAQALQNPISILTQEALDRKQAHNTPIDERDVPVNESYITQLKEANGIAVLSKSKWMNAAFVRGNAGAISALENLAFVASIEYADKSLNFGPVQGGITPSKWQEENNFPKVTYDYGIAFNQTEMIAANYLHEQDFTGEGMIIAVLDSGFPNVLTNPAFTHIVEEGRLLGTYDFAERQTNVDGTGSHGARTFSNIGAKIDDEFVGTAPDASFYLFRTEFAPTENPVEEAWWVEALERADSLGVDVVNTSLGYQDYDNPAYDHSYEDLDGQTTIGARGANHAIDKGLLLVTSGGNDGNGFQFVATPADSPGILSIGAVDSDGAYASFSSIGPTVDGRIKPDVMAQGQSAAVVDEFGSVTTNSGTSFSSPIIAGAVASLWQSRPNTPNHQLMDIIRQSAHLYNAPTDQMGYGIPNFETAFNALQILSVEDQLLQQNFAVFPNPTTSFINVKFPNNQSKATIFLYDVLGNQLLKNNITASTNKIMLDNYSAGIYLLAIKGEGIENTFKIVKQ